jgi:glycerol-3-phosphate dehydrogenase
MGHDTVLWAREPEVVTSVNQQHENTAFLKVLLFTNLCPATVYIPVND